MTTHRGTGATLVTGGAGYVGSFAVRALVAAGERVTVLDDLSEGRRDAVPEGVPLAEVCLRDAEAVRAVLASDDFDAVLHFAASAYVGESVADPRKYWENNVSSALNLLGACLDRGVLSFVLSSTCAVYGEPVGDLPLAEGLPIAPVSPYGRTKAAIERILVDYSEAYGLRSYRLRYFNAAGAAADGSLGEEHEPETHLIPLAIRAAATGGTLRVFGADYPTPDGTCVRDYVHVEDLATAHVAALARLRGGVAGGALNLGTGRGTSVREVVEAVEAVTGLPVATETTARRPGDPAFLVAAPGRAAAELGFTPLRTDIRTIVADAWLWHSRRASG